MKNSICFVIPDNSTGSYQELASNFSAIEPPTWALLLSESCRARGISVSIIDCLPEHLTPEATLTRIQTIRPGIICYVCYGQNPNSSSVNMHGVIEYSTFISSAQPEIYNIIIGPHVAALPVQTLRLHDHINAVSINEGVYTLHDLAMARLNDKNELQKVRGIVFQDQERSIFYGKPAEIVSQSRMEIDLPGYAWDLLPYKEKPLDLYRSHLWHSNYDTNSATPFAAIYTSFGCIFKCAFCMINIVNKTKYSENISSSSLNTMRTLPLSVLKKSFDFFAENNVRNVRICDEMFFLDQSHYQSILGYIIERKYTFNMWAYARVDTIKRSQLQLFKQAGVNWLGVGIESGSELVRNQSIKGGFSLSKIRGVVSATREEGISIGSNFIVGLPSDTFKSCEETAELAIELSTEYINIYPCIDLPGSKLHVSSLRTPSSNYLRYGFLSYETIPNSTETMSAADVLETRDRLWKKIYSAPSVEQTIFRKFGNTALENIKELRKLTLKRKLLTDKFPAKPLLVKKL